MKKIGKSTGKKSIIFVIMLAMILSLSGCGGEKKNDSPAETNNSVQSGKKNIKSGTYKPGDEIPDGDKAKPGTDTNIYGGAIVGDSGTTLTITGSGSLTAQGGSGSGIGGGAGIGMDYTNGGTLSGGNIVINGGTVIATGGRCGAGIGTGLAMGMPEPANITCGDITINGGTVIATGGQFAAGIGTGVSTGESASNGCGAITIGTGVTSVTATKGAGSPNSIGKGDADTGTQTCGTITIGGDATTYATGVTTSPFTYATHSVTITAGDNMTTTGNASQTGLSGAMTDVVYTAADGYYFPENYVASCTVTANSGVSVTRDSYTQITVSGTPTADAEITLPAPTEKDNQSVPETTGFSVTNATNATSADGVISGVTSAMEYSLDGTAWTAVTGTTITGLNPGSVQIRLAGDDTHNASDAVTVAVGDQLADAKTAAKADLDTLQSGKNQNDYDEADWTTLTQAITDGKTAIDNATTIDDVATAKSNAEASANAVKTKAEKLADVKTAAKADLDTLLAGKTEADYDAEDWTTLTQAIADGKTAIDNATTIDGVTTAKTNAETAVNAIKTKAEKLADAKTAAKADLDMLLAGKTEADYDADDWTTLTQAITDGKNSIDNATTIDGVTTAKTNAEASANAVKTKAEKLADAKTAAKADLDTLLAGKTEADYDAEDWTALNQAITDGKTAIDNATTIDGVATAKSNAETAANAVKTTAEKLADAKTAAKADLDTLLDGKTEADYDAEDWTALNQAITDGKTAIDNATTIDGVATAKSNAETAANAVKTTAEKLADAKTAAKADLDTLLDGKTEADYDATDWTTLTQAIADGKTAIDNATTIDDVATAKSNAEASANAVKTTAEKKEEADTAAANGVSDTINNLPAANEVTTANKNAIEAARAAYNALTDDQKAKVSAETLKKLTDAEDRLVVLQVMSEVSAKTGSDMTYTGSPIQLINTPTTALPAGYTMKYAVTTENVKPTDEKLYTTEIPTKTEVGTYYVWYKVVGDINDNDSKAVCITVVIKPQSLTDASVTVDTKDKTVTVKNDRAIVPAEAYHVIYFAYKKIEGGESLKRVGTDFPEEYGEYIAAVVANENSGYTGENRSEPFAIGTTGSVSFNQDENSDETVQTAVKNVESSNLSDFAEELAEEGKFVKVELEITPVKAEKVDQTSVNGTKQIAEGLFVGFDADQVATEYFEIDIKKYVNNEDAGIISDTKNPLEITLTYDNTKMFDPVVVRTHNGETKAFDKLSARPAKADYKDATYYVGDGVIYIYSRYFSDYAIIYTTVKTYNVDIITNTGSNLSKTVAEGSKAGLPTGLSKSGYTFGGWYSDEACTKVWKEDDAVKADITIYAKWTKDPAPTQVPTTVPTSAPTPVPTSAPVTTPTATPTPTVAPTVTPAPVKDSITAEEAARGAIKLNAGLKVYPKNSDVVVKWGKVDNADRYVIYAAYCKKGRKCAKIATLDGDVNSYKFSELNGKPINTKKNIKLYVVAYRKVNGKYKKITSSITAHIVGSGSKKYSNVKGINVESTKITLSLDDNTAAPSSLTLKPTAVLKDSSKKMLLHTAEFRYATSKSSVATVGKDGTITAKGKGTCYIYVYAQNGYAKKVKVTVK